jgi:hypothetical protein
VDTAPQRDLVSAANQQAIFRSRLLGLSRPWEKVREVCRTLARMMSGTVVFKFNAAQELHQAHFAVIQSFHNSLE